MSLSLDCPDVVSLQRLMAGHLSDAEAEPLERHLLHCGRCCGAVRTLKDESVLVAAMRGAEPTAAEGPEGEVVLGLIGRLEGLRAVASDSASEAATVAFVPDETPAEEDGLPSLAGQATEAVYDFLAPARGPKEIGRLGPYRILKVPGAGGMGVVFEAEDLRLQWRVALKAMLPALASHPSARQRFLREARVAAAIEHDHIVRINQVGEDRGVPFLAMPLLKGESLDERLRREKRLPTAEVLRIGREVADGLAAAHQHGLIHRDVKPGNIWLEGAAARVKILDFGLARAAADTAHLTQSGAIVGTAAYMAPEQARGGEVDARCDLFSLGCVLYRTAAGETPFKGGDALATLAALALDNPRPLQELCPEIPPALADLVMGLLTKDPAGRPASAGAVVKAIEAIERGRETAGEREQAASFSDLPASRKGLPRAPASLSAGRSRKAPRRRSRLGWWVFVLVLPAAALGLTAYEFGPDLYSAVLASSSRQLTPPTQFTTIPEATPLLKDAVLVMTFEKDAFYDKDGKTYVRDLSGQGSDGLCDGVSYIAEGKAGGGLLCDGKGALRLPVSLFNHQPNYTFTAWFRPVDDGRTGEIGNFMAESNPTNDQQAIYGVPLFRNGMVRACAWNHDRGTGDPDENKNWLNAGADAGVFPLAAGQWVFLAISLEKGGVDSGLLRIAIDDREYGLTMQAADSPNQTVAHIGWKMSGVVDEVALFHRVLSVPEIEAIRQQGLHGVPLAGGFAAAHT